VRSSDGELSAGDERSRARPLPRPATDFEATAEIPRSRMESDAWTPAADAAKAEPEPEAESEKSEAGAGRPVRSRSASRADARQAEAAARKRQSRVTVAASVLVVVIAVLLIPQVRTILRQSFTRMPQESVAIYFTSSPKISGTLLDVPLTVQGVNSGTATYAVKVWTENASGKVDGTTTAKIGTAHGLSAAVVTLPIATDAAEVWVSLDGTSQVLHYQI